MKNIQRFFPHVLVVISVLFLVLFYGDLFYRSNSHLFNVTGDAIKNYYTYAAHSKQQEFIQFEQMNYPYGENFLYLDCHPVFTVIIKIVAKIFPGIHNYTIGIINFLMLFGIALTALFTYLILVKFKTDKLFALFGAFAISILSPQLFRITSHFALSYSFFIPLTWFLYIRFRESENKLRWSFIIMANSIFWYFIHGYMGMITVAFIFLTFLINFLFEKKKFMLAREWMYLFIQTIIPLAFFYIFIRVTDTHPGRNDQPYGILTYVANFQSVFLPSHPPLKNFYNDIFKIETNWEGWAYIGIGSILFILAYVLNSVLKIFRIRMVKDATFNNDKILVPSLIASVILLFLSMGYPFKLNMEYLLDWFPIINNFRGIARFSWPFYYTISISTIVFFSLLLPSGKSRFVVFIILLFIPFSYILEGLPHHETVRKKMTGYPNLFNAKYLPESFIQGLNFADSNKYQAIVPLPFFHIGCEDYKAIGTDKSHITSMVISYHSGIPIMGNYSTNTSIIESKNLIQVLSPNCYNKAIIFDIQSRKPFLVVHTNEDLNKYESDLLFRSQKIFSCGDFTLYSISYDNLLVNNSKTLITDYQKIKDHLTAKNGFMVSGSDTSGYLFFDSFENGKSDTTHTGMRAMKGQFKKYTPVVNIDPKKLTVDKEYTVSFWMYNQGEKFGQGALSSMAFVQTKDRDGKINWISTTNPARSVVIDGDWNLVELTFKMPSAVGELGVYIKGDDKSEKFFYLDDLLIKEKDVDVYKVIRESNGIIKELFANNNFIK
ncbi:MAG TPA: hypothetical protein VK212_01010 [Lentimicrobium sp.]|nr:hypothetical protein [Lentimicrobium sp.]